MRCPDRLMAMGAGVLRLVRREGDQAGGVWGIRAWREKQARKKPESRAWVCLLSSLLGGLRAGPVRLEEKQASEGACCWGPRADGLLA